MPNFQLLSCIVALGGDQNNKTAKGFDRPVTYPEYLVLQYLHGEASVLDVKEVGRIERSDREERDRLTYVYGGVVVELFPGLQPRMPVEDSFPVCELGSAFQAAQIAVRAERAPAEEPDPIVKRVMENMNAGAVENPITQQLLAAQAATEAAQAEPAPAPEPVVKPVRKSATVALPEGADDVANVTQE